MSAPSESPNRATSSFDIIRKTAIAIGIIIILLVSGVSIIYLQTPRQGWTRIVYQSPSDGVALVIDEWRFGSFIGVQPPANVYISIGCVGNIVEWNGDLGELYYNFDYKIMTPSEFQNLNDSEIEDLFNLSQYSILIIMEHLVV